MEAQSMGARSMPEMHRMGIEGGSVGGGTGGKKWAVGVVELLFDVDDISWNDD
jgi:hypothetical protein